MGTVTGQVCRYSHTVGGFNDYARGFYNPVDVAVRGDGVMYVVSRAVELAGKFKRITICTVDGEFLGEFSGIGTGDGQIMWPSSCALDADGYLYVSDEALHRISVFDGDGGFVRKWGVRGRGEGEFEGPSGMAFDEEGNLLVVDGLNHRVQRYSREGEYLGGWGRFGSGDGEFNMPWGISVDGRGHVYVADWRNDRIQKFDGDGAHLGTFGRPGSGDGELSRPSWAGVDDDGNMYVADWGNERLQVLSPDGGFLMASRGEATMSTWGEEYYVSNMDELELRKISVLEPSLDPSTPDFLQTQSSVIEKLFWGPTSVKLDDQGRVFVVDCGRHRIQIFQRTS